MVVSATLCVWMSTGAATELFGLGVNVNEDTSVQVVLDAVSVAVSLS